MATYVQAGVEGSLCFTSGELPFRVGVAMHTGVAGQEVGVYIAFKAARIVALNAVSTLADAAGRLSQLEA